MISLQQVLDWPVGNAAAGVARSFAPDIDRVDAFTVVGEAELVFTWASLTKLCTSLAVLVAIEEGTLGFDTPAGPPGATVGHLLAHASGLGPSGTRVVANPGERRIYSNVGFEILGNVVEQQSGINFPTYLREAVFEPIGMNGATLGRGMSAAYGVSGTLKDLLLLGAELLDPQIVSPETILFARSVAFKGLPGILPGFGYQNPCDWGMGFEIRDSKSPHWTGRLNSPETFGHFGRDGGFLWIDPVARLACGALSDTRFGPWAKNLWPVLSDDILIEAKGGEIQ